MKKSTTLLITACAVPALLAFALPVDRVAFGVAQGASITKTFTSTNDLTLEDMTIVMNGEEIDMSMMGGGFDMNVSHAQTVQVTDEYLAVGEGRSSKLRRTFDSLNSDIDMESSGGPMGGGDSSMTGVSELEGLTVEFDWDDDAGEYSATFADGSDGDDDLLENLFEDMDLRDLLPEGDVSVGDSWEIDPNALLAILAPGGNLKILPDDTSEMPMQQMPGAMNAFDNLGDFEGSFTGEYAGERDVDGTTVGVVKLTFEATTTKDMTDLMAEMMDEMDLPDEMGEMEISYDAVDVEFEYSGSGELLWNLSEGHFHAFEVSGDVLMAMDMAYSMGMQGMDMSMEMSMEMSGTQQVGATIGAAE